MLRGHRIEEIALHKELILQIPWGDVDFGSELDYIPNGNHFLGIADEEGFSDEGSCFVLDLGLLKAVEVGCPLMLKFVVL